MGFLSRLFKSGKPGLVHLPAGSFTLDRDGHIMTSTLPQSFPVEHLKAIGNQVLASFRSAKKAQMPLSEIIIQYSALKLLARELRGGAIIFVMPQSLQRLNPKLKKAA
jgi:hypothetical protein